MTNDPISNLTVPSLTSFDEAALDKAFAALAAQARDSAAAIDGPEAVEAFRLEWLAENRAG